MAARLLCRLAALGLVLSLLACAGPPTLSAMKAAAPPAAMVTAPGAVSVVVTGGQQGSALDGALISDADFKAAIEASLLQARAFEGLAAGDASRYTLSAGIVRLARPLWGGTMTVELEVGWTLVDKVRQQTMLRKVINASGTATMSDTLAGATRIRLAVEAAARNNIEAMLRELAALTR